MRRDLKIAVLDPREVRLPFFNWSTASASAPVGDGCSERAADTRHRSIGDFDGFIAVAPEYNHGPTTVSKNPFDSAILEWQRKPIAFVGYGRVGTAHAIEAMRAVAIGLQMAPISAEINIAWEPFLAVLQRGKSLNDFQYLVRSRDRMFEQLAWWGEALKAARQESSAKRTEVA